MNILYVSLASAAVAYGLVALLFDPLAAIVPAVVAFGGVAVGLLLRVKRRVDDALAVVGPMLQERRVEDARQALGKVRKEWAKWMPLLDGQIDAQLGMIDYYQLKFDAALPLLQKGQWRNWLALDLIGCVHYRRGRKIDAYAAFQKAIDAAPKEMLPYAVFAGLAHRSGDDDKALQTVTAGLASLPGNKVLEDIRGKLANKRKFKASEVVGEQWVQFFPEEMAAQAQIAARKGTPLPGPGFRGPGVSKQARRGR